ncbi:MAG TPA: TonB-dependent receptor plug domain-containing protein, partial [Rhizomicrobium sp.]|nr:TonB-dependent receptor plug domain-containing protein [Rhizomicrobium sp.]
MSRSILFTTAATIALSGAALIASIAAASAQPAEQTEDITVTAQQLSAARAGIQTQLGASTYTVTAKDIEAQPGGDNSLLNSVILQMPDVAQDSYGQFHVRGEHNQLQYRINGIILPEGISVFGQTLDPRLAESVKLIDGALPAEYGLQTGGIVDIQTKSGVFEDGGHVSMYGGSHNTLQPSFDYGGSVGHLNYFVSGDYDTNSLGIEAPYSTHTPDHDRTKQWHGFAFVQDILDNSSSLTAILGTSNDMFQIPNTPGLQPSGIGVVGLGPLDPGG